jgi:hypothetical protein
LLDDVIRILGKRASMGITNAYKQARLAAVHSGVVGYIRTLFPAVLSSVSCSVATVSRHRFSTNPTTRPARVAWLWADDGSSDQHQAYQRVG